MHVRKQVFSGTFTYLKHFYDFHQNVSVFMSIHPQFYEAPTFYMHLYESPLPCASHLSVSFSMHVNVCADENFLPHFALLARIVNSEGKEAGGKGMNSISLV